MLNISKEAVQQLIEFKSRRGPDRFVRIGILSGSTSGPSLGVTIDDKGENDEQFSFEGLQLIVDKALLGFCETITVEYVQQKGGSCSSGGFKLTPKNKV